MGRDAWPGRKTTRSKRRNTTVTRRAADGSTVTERNGKLLFRIQLPIIVPMSEGQLEEASTLLAELLVENHRLQQRRQKDGLQAADGKRILRGVDSPKASCS